MIVRTVNALRGTDYRPEVFAAVRPGVRVVHLDLAETAAPTVRVLLANVPVSHAAYEAAVKGTPLLSSARLRVLDDVWRELRSAVRSAPKGTPSLVVFPELSIPRRWRRTLERQASSENVSVIAGLEYRATAAGLENQAVGIFTKRMRVALPVCWTKRHPARVEVTEIPKITKGRQQFSGGTIGRRLVVDSRYGRLGVLICSELLEAQALADLVGHIELLAVPAWNPDTASFDYVANAAAGLLVHTFVAIANNAEASDSRILTPIKTPRWEREWCRIIHRNESRAVWADVPLGQLRQVHRGGARTFTDPDGQKRKFRPLPPAW